MDMTRRILPYTKQLVTFALYDVLDQEHGEYQMDGQSGGIAADLSVYGNRIGFRVCVREQSPATELTVAVTKPCDGLSEQGKQRAADFLADRVAQLLENELRINALLGRKAGGDAI